MTKNVTFRWPIKQTGQFTLEVQIPEDDLGFCVEIRNIETQKAKIKLSAREYNEAITAATNAAIDSIMIVK
jgi:hypothetical protein